MRKAMAEREDDTPADGRRFVSMALRLPPETHEVLRKIAFERRVSIHSLIMSGVAEVLRQHGK